MCAKRQLDLTHDVADILDPQPCVEQVTSQYPVGQDNLAGTITINLCNDIGGVD